MLHLQGKGALRPEVLLRFLFCRSFWGLRLVVETLSGKDYQKESRTSRIDLLQVIRMKGGHTCSCHLACENLLQPSEEIHRRQSYYAIQRTCLKLIVSQNIEKGVLSNSHVALCVRDLGRHR
jgi:hypothetical protein